MSCQLFIALHASAPAYPAIICLPHHICPPTIWWSTVPDALHDRSSCLPVTSCDSEFYLPALRSHA